MPTFHSLLSPFWKPTSATQPLTNHCIQQPHTYSSSTSAATLNRMSLALDASLTAAASRLSTLHAHLHTTLSTYEKHYVFLRHIAHDAIGSNAALRRSAAQLERTTQELEEAFEAVEVAVEVARLKARVQKEGMEGVMAEDARLWESRGAGDMAVELRARAVRRWKGAEREHGE
ncbi:hypothetical protein PMIN06_004457 [Paraphaeosphaeria minitans]